GGVRQLLAVGQAAAHEQALHVRAAAEDRAHVGGGCLAEAEARRIIALAPGALELLDARAAAVAAATLDEVVLVQPAAAAAARGRAAVAAAARRCGLAAEAAEPTEAAAAQREDRPLPEVDAQLLAVAVRDRAQRVGHGDAEHAAGGPQVLGLADAHTLGEAEVDGQGRAVGERDERAARLDEPLEVEHAAQPEAAAHVVGRGLPADVGRQLAGLPRDRPLAREPA